MKALWIVGTPRNVIYDILGEKRKTNVSGGWVDVTYESAKNDVDIDFLCCKKGLKKNTLLKKSNDTSSAYCIPLPKASYGVKGGSKIISLIKEAIKDSKPDVIHVWGSESGLAHDVIKANEGKIPVIVFVQGLIGIHSLYFVGGAYSLSEIKLPLIAKYKTLISKTKQYYYKKQYQMEKDVAHHIDAILTDNDLTRYYFHALNSKIKNFEYSLTVNKVFNNYKWNLDTCKKHTIFTVYGHDMNKGLFQLIQAVNLLRVEFPDIKLLIPGPYKIEKTYNVPNRKLSVFEMWAKKYVKKHHLENNIEFVGYQTAEGMAKHLSQSHIFVSPSCMEVQSTSVRESMFVGTPTISSLCGSLLEFIVPDVNGCVYRYDEIISLSSYISKLFNNNDFAIQLGQNAYDSIRKNFKIKDEKTILNIYKELIDGKAS